MLLLRQQIALRIQKRDALILMHRCQEPLDPARATDRVAHREQLAGPQHASDGSTLQGHLDIRYAAEGWNAFQPVNIRRLVRSLKQLFDTLKITGRLETFCQQPSHRGLRILRQFI
ncbi:hypothetical protein D3C75_978820 [compost metagenome]